MENVVLFTRQRGETSTESEQEALEAQIRVIEAFARRERLQIVDRVARVGIGAGELFQELDAYLLEHTTARAIITYSMSRLCRSVNHIQKLESMVKDGGQLRIYLADEQLVLTADSPLAMPWEKPRKPPVGYRTVDGKVVFDGLTALAVQEAFKEHRDSPGTIRAQVQHLGSAATSCKAAASQVGFIPWADLLTRVISQYYSDSLSEKIKLRLRDALDRGRWIGIAPIGYTNIRTRNNEPNIIPQEPYFSLVRESFELLAAGAVALDGCLEEMTRRGLLSPRGNKLTNRQFKRMLHNPAYIGKIPTKKYGVMPGIHVACVTEAVFDQVQLELKRSNKNTNRSDQVREAVERSRRED